jgi:fructose-1,6-bisphosphatase II
MSTIAVATPGALWSPGPAYYMDKLVLPPAAPRAAGITDSPETTVAALAAALGKEISELRAVVLDKPRHGALIERLRGLGVIVAAPPAGDVAGALSVLLPGGGADLLLGIGGTPEGVMAACAVRALGGGMQARLAPQRQDERERVQRAGLSLERTLGLEDLVAGDATFVATGVTGGLLAAPRHEDGWVVTESLVIAARSVRFIRHHSPTEE